MFKIIIYFFIIIGIIISSWFFYQKTHNPPTSETTKIDFPIIDTHSHLSWRDKQGETAEQSLAVAISDMKKNRVAFAIFMPPPFANSQSGIYDSERLKNLSMEGSYGFGAGGGSLNAMIQETPANQVTEEIKKIFQKTAEKIVSDGALVFSETAALHLIFTSNHAEFQETLPNHPLFFELADIAAEHNIPIDIHMEAVPEDMATPPELLAGSSEIPLTLSANITVLEELLDHNKNTKIIWAHAGMDSIGTRTVELMRELLEKHSNLYMSLKNRDSRLQHNSLTDNNGTLKDEWKKLLIDFSDRFVIGSDHFFSISANDPGGNSENSQLDFTDLLKQLPTETAENIAYKNAEKIFNIKLED